MISAIGYEKDLNPVALDPIHQFKIQKLVPIEVGGLDLSFTNSSLFMVMTVVGASAFLILSTRGRGLVPGRWQSAAEMTYEFVAKTLRDSAGGDGMRFFPFVFSLFMFILVANLWGMIPYFFTVTSHIIVTAALALTASRSRGDSPTPTGMAIPTPSAWR